MVEWIIEGGFVSINKLALDLKINGFLKAIRLVVSTTFGPHFRVSYK